MPRNDARPRRGDRTVPAPQGTRRRSRERQTPPQRPERDDREVAAELSRPDEPGGEMR